MHECQVREIGDNILFQTILQSRGVSPSCIKHLRLLKQFLLSLSAVKRGAAPLGPALYPLSTTAAKAEADNYPEEEDSFGTNYGLLIHVNLSYLRTNKLAKLGDAIAISKSETIND